MTALEAFSAAAVTPERPHAVEVLAPGLFTTVQDLGRPGYAQFGVPDGGAMDKFALAAGNALVGNPPGEAGLEVTHAGFALRVLRPLLLAVTGADLGLHVNGAPAPLWCPLWTGPGDVLRFTARRRGVRAYVALAGGIDVPLVMGSRSTYVRGRFGGFHGRALRRGDRLAVGSAGLRGGGPHQDLRDRHGLCLPRPLQRLGVPRPVRVIPGPQADGFAPVAWQRLLGATYEVTPQSDRMGCRLRGPRLPASSHRSYVSDGIAPGSIQVPGDGQPILLLADRQTTGGYPKIATVISADLDFLAHGWPGEAVTFRAVDVDEAHRLRAGRAEMLAEVRRFAQGE